MLSILVCHSYFLRFDQKQQERAKPYPPLATLQVASMLRKAGHEVSLFDAMLAEDLERFERQLDVLKPQLVLLYEDNYNFLSKMCLGRMRRAACEMLRAGARARRAADRRGLRCLRCAGQIPRRRGPCRAARRSTRDAAWRWSTGSITRPSRWRRDNGSRVCPMSAYSDRTACSASRGKSRRCRNPPPRPLPGLGPGRHREISPRLAARPRLLQPQHGRIARLLVPLQLVRETHLGQSIPAAPAARSGGGNDPPAASLSARPHLVRRRHLRISRSTG